MQIAEATPGILLTGPTGSGRQYLYASLSNMDSDVKGHDGQDPVEYQLRYQ